MEMTGIGATDSLLGDYRHDRSYYAGGAAADGMRGNMQYPDPMAQGNQFAIWPPIEDLDLFFASMYTYYKHRGLPAIILSQV